jgi:tetratricopeptide (TPR) repeat protein
MTMRWLIIISVFYTTTVKAVDNDSTILLIADMIIQIEATEAMNAMYNFDFDEANKQYHWLMQKHPESPLSYFLLGLNEWWKMMPDTDVEIYDERFHYFMDTTILIAEKMLEVPETRIEGAFFLAATYGFKGRLYSDRGKWGKAASAGKSSLKYLEISQEQSYLSPELLFGNALYNYFAVWIPDNYPILKPILAFFPDGDKELGLQQLREVSLNAFYTRIEAQIFLMQILANDKHDYAGALAIAEYLHNHYPNNPYFHRYYARYLYSLHRYSEMEPVALEILERVDSAMIGYEPIGGRYAAFFLGQSYQSRGDYEKASQFYLRAVEFARQREAMDTGYCLYSLLNLGKIAKQENEKKLAKNYFKQVKHYASRKQAVYKEAKTYLKAL